METIYKKRQILFSLIIHKQKQVRSNLIISQLTIETAEMADDGSRLNELLVPGEQARDLSENLETFIARINIEKQLHYHFRFEFSPLLAADAVIFVSDLLISEDKADWLGKSTDVEIGKLQGHFRQFQSVFYLQNQKL